MIIVNKKIDKTLIVDLDYCIIHKSLLANIYSNSTDAKKLL